MNGGPGSTLPARNTTARPVSFHSLSEHQRNSPPYLPPNPHRRPRTPRSSPLAGPSVSPDQTDGENKDDEGSQKPRYRPNRISSIPDVAAPVQSLYDSDAISSYPPFTVSNGTNAIVFPHPPTSRPSTSRPSTASSSGGDDKEKDFTKGDEDADFGSTLRNLAKRISTISLSSFTTNENDKDDQKVIRQRSSFSLYSASTSSLASTVSSRTVQTDKTSQTVPPIPTIPRWALNAMREEAGAANRNMNYGHGPDTNNDPTTLSSSPLPNQPIPPVVLPSISGLSNQPHSPSISHDPTENWVSLTDMTPRFSRMGLGDGVILPRPKSAGSITSMKSTATLSQFAGARRDSGVTSKTESNPAMDSNNSSAADTKANPKGEEALRKRGSFAGPLKTKVSRVSISSSARSENVPPLPRTISKSDFFSARVTTSRTSLSSFNDSTLTLTTSVPPPSAAAPPDLTRRSLALRRDSGLTATSENRLPSSPNGIPTEFGGKTADMKSQDTQKSKMSRKNIKQIVMRITASPMSAGEKVKLTTIHHSSSTPVVVLPPDTLMPLDPPPSRRFNKSANSSVPNLPSTKEVSEFSSSKGSGKRFKGLRKRWDAVFSTVRR